MVARPQNLRLLPKRYRKNKEGKTIAIGCSENEVGAFPGQTSNFSWPLTKTLESSCGFARDVVGSGHAHVHSFLAFSHSRMAFSFIATNQWRGQRRFLWFPCVATHQDQVEAPMKWGTNLWPIRSGFWTPLDEMRVGHSCGGILDNLGTLLTRILSSLPTENRLKCNIDLMNNWPKVFRKHVVLLERMGLASILTQTRPNPHWTQRSKHKPMEPVIVNGNVHTGRK